MLSFPFVPPNVFAADKQRVSLPPTVMSGTAFSDEQFGLLPVTSQNNYYRGGFRTRLQSNDGAPFVGTSYSYSIEIASGGNGPDGGFLKSIFAGTQVLVMYDDQSIDISGITGKINGATPCWFAVATKLVSLIVPADTVGQTIAKELIQKFGTDIIKSTFFNFNVPAEISRIPNGKLIRVKPEAVVDFKKLEVSFNLKYKKSGAQGLIIIIDALGMYLRIPGGITSTVEWPASYLREIIVKRNVGTNFDFSISNSGAVTVTRGSSGSTRIAVTLTSGSTQPVSLSYSSGLPSGASCSFNPSSGNPTFSSALTIKTSSSTRKGSYTITIAGTGGGKSHTTRFTLTIQ